MKNKVDELNKHNLKLTNDKNAVIDNNTELSVNLDKTQKELQKSLENLFKYEKELKTKINE